MSTVVTINGTPADVPRTVVPGRLVPFCKGGHESFSFQVRGGKLPTEPDGFSGATVAVTINGTLRFAGQVVSRGPLQVVPGKGWVRAYQSLGLSYLADWVRHTDSNNGGDQSTYNALADNAGPDYIAARAGRTVGQILTDVLTSKANAQGLAAVGVGQYTGLPTAPALPAATVADLAALAFIPPGPVGFGGSKLWTAVTGFLSQWAPTCVPRIRPDGTLRFLDQRSFTPYTLTMGTDPVIPGGLSRDTTECASRVELFGADLAEMFLFSTRGYTSTFGLSESAFAHGGLTVAQSKAAWTPADWLSTGLPGGLAKATASLTTNAVTGVSVTDPGFGYGAVAPRVTFTGGGGSGAAATATVGGGKVTSVAVTAGGSGYATAPSVVIEAAADGSSDAGTCTCTSTTTVRVTSLNPKVAWGANYWDQTGSGRHGSLFLSWSAGTDVTTYAQRRVVADTAMAAGGTSDLTLDRALPHTNYNAYALTGLARSASAVWTAYQLPSWAAPLVAPQSTYPFAYHLASAAAATLTSSALGSVLWSGDGNPPYSEVAIGVVVDAVAGLVHFSRPTWMTAGNRAPDEVRALVPIYVGVNRVASPPDVAGVPQFAGDYFTVEAKSRTLPVYVPNWRDPGNGPNMQLYADNLLDSVKNPIVEGQVVYLGLYEPALEMGAALQVSGTGFASPWSAATLPIVETQLDYQTGPGCATSWVTTMRVSNRMAHYSAEAFMRPDRTGVTFDWSGSIDLSRYRSSAAMATNAAIGAMASYGADVIDAAGRAAASLPQSPADLGIPTNPGGFLPSAADFSGFGLDLKGKGGGDPGGFLPSADDFADFGIDLKGKGGAGAGGGA